MRVGGDYVDELVVVAVEGTVAVLNSVLIDWLHDEFFFNDDNKSTYSTGLLLVRI